MTRQAVKLAHLIARPFAASSIRSRDSDLDARARRGGGAPDRFERRVFPYLAMHKREHGIVTVHKFGNVRMDGMIRRSSPPTWCPATACTLSPRCSWA
jgi:hypothetical protein